MSSKEETNAHESFLFATLPVFLSVKLPLCFVAAALALHSWLYTPLLSSLLSSSLPLLSMLVFVYVGVDLHDVSGGPRCGTDSRHRARRPPNLPFLR